MKNLFKITGVFLTLTLMLMLLTTTVFAEEIMTKPVQDISVINIETNVTLDKENLSKMEFTENEHKNEQIFKMRGPAPQVSSVTPLSVYINSNGNFVIKVLIMGYGSYNATLNGNTAKCIGWYDTVGRNPVTGWYEEFDCGRAYIGTHTFNITARSYNSPYTTKSASVTFRYY